MLNETKNIDGKTTEALYNGWISWNKFLFLFVGVLEGNPEAPEN